MSTEERGGRSRVRPLSTLLVSRVRLPETVHTARVTVLFADLRGYTGMAERLPAARVLPLLDEFCLSLASAAEAHGGTVFYMAGDGMMAGFGLHAESGHGAREALAAGHDMLDAFSVISSRWHGELAIDAGIGIGLHLGEVAVGPLGPRRHKRTTLVGDTVNVAARLCSRARAGEVLFSCTVAEALQSSAAASPASNDAVAGGARPFLQLPQFELRGRRGTIDIWCVPALERLAL